MKTVKLITEAREKLRLNSDLALAKHLDVSHATVGHWRTGTRLPDATQCAKLAVIIGLEPIEVIAAIESQRLKRAAENEVFWSSQVRKVREFIESLMKKNQTSNC